MIKDQALTGASATNHVDCLEPKVMTGVARVRVDDDMMPMLRETREQRTLISILHFEQQSKAKRIRSHQITNYR